MLIEQPEIFLDPKSKYKGIKPDAFKVLADAFRSRLATQMAQYHPVVERPGPGVIRLRLALTNVYLKKDRATGWAELIARARTSEIQAAVGRNISLVEATMEAEALDSETGSRIGVVVAQRGQRKVKELDVHEQPTSWSDLLEGIDRLVEVSQALFSGLFTNETTK